MLAPDEFDQDKSATPAVARAAGTSAAGSSAVAAVAAVGAAAGTPSSKSQRGGGLPTKLTTPPAGPSTPTPNSEPSISVDSPAGPAAAAAAAEDTTARSTTTAAAAAPPHHTHFPALFTLLAVSATPIDMLAFCVKAKLPVRVVMLDREVMSGNGYVGPADLKPFRDGARDEVGRGRYLQRDQQ